MQPAPPPVDPVSALEPPEIVYVDSHRVCCDGGVGALGHPRVYMEMGDSGYVECGYCDRRFVLGPHDHGEDERLDPGTNEGPGTSPS